MTKDFDPKNEYRESIDEFAGATVELLAEVLKKKHPLMTKESMHKCISMIGFMLFDSYKKKDVSSAVNTADSHKKEKEEKDGKL